jgi:hypothetical protein
MSWNETAPGVEPVSTDGQVHPAGSLPAPSWLRIAELRNNAVPLLPVIVNAPSTTDRESPASEK